MSQETSQNLTGKAGQKSLPSAHLRMIISVLVGLIGGALTATFASWRYAPLAGWDIGAITFLSWLWLALRPLDSHTTSRLAVTGYHGRAAFDGLLMTASLASLAAVGILFFQASHSTGLTEIMQAGLGIISVVISWAVVHSVYALRYATVYYKNQGGIDFNTNLPPAYSDFAYFAFTIGMTFQVADTNLTSPQFRKIVLTHSLLSYLFGTVIVASAISLIIGLGK